MCGAAAPARSTTADESLFNGDVLTGRMALTRGLIDGIGELRAVMRARYGDKVRLRPVARRAAPAAVARACRLARASPSGRRSPISPTGSRRGCCGRGSGCDAKFAAERSLTRLTALPVNLGRCSPFPKLVVLILVVRRGVDRLSLAERARARTAAPARARRRAGRSRPRIWSPAGSAAPMSRRGAPGCGRPDCPRPR